MKFSLALASLLVAGSAVGGTAARANTCQAETLMCTTTMPIGGYCECTSKGATQSGTVTATPPRRPVNSTAGGCGAHPEAPGCH
jgi:hypothetical protein